jgi:hypothetical protein
MTVPDASSDDDLVPVSVRLGEVVPPEDPEDWTRPLTWVAALGMLAAAIVAVAWFAIAPPTQGVQAGLATYVVALALAAGASATGATQQGVARAATATLGAGLFGSLVVIIVGVVMAGERQVGVASPTLSHAFGAAVGGTAGAVAGSLVAAIVARLWDRPVRFLITLVASGFVAWVTVLELMPVAVK